jgi:hypothetical protein
MTRNLEKGFLRNIFCILFIPGHSIRQAVYFPSVGVVKHRKTLFVPIFQVFDEFFLLKNFHLFIQGRMSKSPLQTVYEE